MKSYFYKKSQKLLSSRDPHQIVRLRQVPVSNLTLVNLTLVPNLTFIFSDYGTIAWTAVTNYANCYLVTAVEQNKCILAGQKAQSIVTRGGIEDTRLEAKAKDRKKSEAKAKDRKKSEAKDRNARGENLGPRTQAQMFSKKKNFFSGDLQKQKNVFKNFCLMLELRSRGFYI